MPEISQEVIDDTLQSLIQHIRATGSATEHHRSAGMKGTSNLKLQTSLSGLLKEWEKFSQMLVQIVCINCDGVEGRQPTPQPSKFSWKKASDLPRGLCRVFEEAMKQLATQNDTLVSEDNGAVAREGRAEDSRIDAATFAGFHKQKDTHLREIRGLKDDLRRLPFPITSPCSPGGDQGAGEAPTDGDPEDWKRKGHMGQQSDSDEASQSRYPMLRSMQDVESVNSPAPESQLRTHLYRQHLRFIFCFIEIYYSFKHRSATLCTVRPANQAFDRQSGVRNFPLQNKGISPNRQGGPGESTEPPVVQAHTR